MRKVLQADLHARAWVLILLAMSLAVAGATVVMGSRLAGQSAQASYLPDAAYAATFGPLTLLAWVLTWGLTILTILVAYLIVRLSIFTWRTGTFPPPGTRTLRPVLTVTGSAAKQRAVGGIVVGMLLTGFSIMLPILMTVLAERLFA